MNDSVIFAEGVHKLSDVILVTKEKHISKYHGDNPLLSVKNWD